MPLQLPLMPDLTPVPTAPYVVGSPTSEAAAEAILDSLPALQRRVYEYIRQWGPVHDEEIQIDLNMNPSTERPRRGELVEKGLVCDTGHTALTKSGRNAVLWDLVGSQRRRTVERRFRKEGWTR